TPSSAIAASRPHRCCRRAALRGCRALSEARVVRRGAVGVRYVDDAVAAVAAAHGIRVGARRVVRVVALFRDEGRYAVARLRVYGGKGAELAARLDTSARAAGSAVAAA